jgi:hypothetical protein
MKLNTFVNQMVKAIMIENEMELSEWMDTCWELVAQPEHNEKLEAAIENEQIEFTAKARKEVDTSDNEAVIEYVANMINKKIWSLCE